MPNVTTDGVDVGDGSATLYGSWNAVQDGFANKVWFLYGIGGTGIKTDEQDASPGDGSYSQQVSTQSDRSYQFKARGFLSSSYHDGDVLSFKSSALAPTAGTPTSSAVTKNSATIACTFDAKVVESTFSVSLYYRKFGDTTWIAAGAAVTSGTSISRDLSGLLAYTTYQFKLSGSRTTENTQSWESVVSTFTTLADAPVVHTNAATVVTSNQAQLNGTVDPNNVANVTVQFGWGTADGGAVLASWQNATTPQGVSGDGDRGFQQQISGLSPSTPYFFRAFVNW